MDTLAVSPVSIFDKTSWRCDNFCYTTILGRVKSCGCVDFLFATHETMVSIVRIGIFQIWQRHRADNTAANCGPGQAAAPRRRRPR